MDERHPVVGTAHLGYGEAVEVRARIEPGAPLVGVELLLPYRTAPDGAGVPRGTTRLNAGDRAFFPAPEAAALDAAGVATLIPAGA